MPHSLAHFDLLARKFQTSLYLYIDIETIPSQDPSVLDAIRAKHVVPELDLSAVEADKRLTDPAKINADIEKKRLKAAEDHIAAVAKAEIDIDIEWRKTALDASTGQIASMSFSLADDGIHSLVDSTHGADKALLDRTVTRDAPVNEKGMIEALFRAIDIMIEARAAAEASMLLDAEGRPVTQENVRIEQYRFLQVPVIVAHFAQFDVRFIWQRAIILGVTPPAWWPIDARPRETDRINDTMVMWAGHGNRIGLDRLCRALGVVGKTGVDGSKVWDLVRAGRIDEVVEYCDDDVRRLRSVHRKMLGLPVLEIDAIVVPVAAEEKEAA